MPLINPQGAPGITLIGKVVGADISTSAVDITIPIVLPPGFSRYRFNNIAILANGGSGWAGATIQFYTAAASGGIALTGALALTSLTTNVADTAGNLQASNTAATTVSLGNTSLFAHVNTGAGVASTIDIYIYSFVIL